MPFAAVFAVGNNLVFDKRSGAGLAVLAHNLHFTMAVLAAKFGIRIADGIGHRLGFPERS